MRKHVLKVWDLPSSGGTAVLFILSVAFVVGCVAGCVLVNQVGGSGEAALEAFFDEYLSVVNSGGLTQPNIFSLVWETFRWPIFIILLSVTPLGLFAIPILFLIRGFLFSFSIASFFRVLSTSGLILAFALFGFTGLLYVPVLFVLGVQGFLCSGTMTGRLMGEGRKRLRFDRIALFRCCFCIVVLLVCCFLEYYLVPFFIESLAAFILS